MPDDLDRETWFRRYAVKYVSKWMALVKITLPDSDRAQCLRMLNMMNVNHERLFPDLEGAAQHANMALSVPRYR